MNKQKILIVEDSKAIARMLADILTENNYLISGIADSGEEAINIVRKALPDLILMDIELNGSMDGIEAAKEINRTADLPVIFLSAIERIENPDRIKAVGSYAFLAKPFKKTELLYTIEISLYKHQMIMKVKESEERLNNIWNNIQTAILIIDEDSNSIVNVNPKAMEIMGLPSESIAGHNRKEFFINLYNADLLKDAHYNDTITREAILINKNKERIPVFITTKIIKVGGKHYSIVSFIDTSEQKKNEQEIRNARDEIQNLLSSLVTILIGISTKDEVTHWNKIAEKTFGIHARDVIGMPLTLCNIKWDWPVIYEGISRSITDDKQVRLNDLHFTDSGNNDGFLDITVNPIKDKDSALKGFILTGEDITKRKRLEMRLSHAQKMEAIGELSSGIAHEINTPTQYIMDNIYFLQDSFPKLLNLLNKYKELCKATSNGNNTMAVLTEIKEISCKDDLDYIFDEIPKAISQSIDGLSKVAKIVKSIKNFAYPASDTMTFIDIKNALEDTINISRNEWKYSTDIITHFDGSLPPVPCFPGELNQVFLNIIINAVDAIKEKNEKNPKQKGVIEISTGIEKSRVIITIKDNGIGIPENIITRIFDPFFTTKKVGTGTGQGLAIAYDIIVNKHRGTIFYKSAAGSGTTCIIKIPVYEKTNNG
ncbi:MAG: response regulator [Spirochaetes bacterium]|nr:response regulator [Spirochaetota bacterium]